MQTSLKMIFIWSSSLLFITDLIKIGHLVGLGSKVHGSRFRVNRFAIFFDLPVRCTQTGATDFTG
jgi:hypothetical protein